MKTLELPCLDRIQQELFALTKEDVAYAQAALSFEEKEGDNGEFLDVLLGSTLQDLCEPALLAVLVAHYMLEQDRVYNNEQAPPVGIAKESWLTTLIDEKVQPAAAWSIASLFTLARITGQKIPENYSPKIVFYRGQFRVVIYPDVSMQEDEEESPKITTLSGRFSN